MKKGVILTMDIARSMLCSHAIGSLQHIMLFLTLSSEGQLCLAIQAQLQTFPFQATLLLDRRNMLTLPPDDLSKLVQTRFDGTSINILVCVSNTVAQYRERCQ